MSSRDDRACLEDMLESLRRIEVFTAGLEYQDFKKDLRDRQEISWTIWGPSVPHIGSRPI